VKIVGKRDEKGVNTCTCRSRVYKIARKPSMGHTHNDTQMGQYREKQASGVKVVQLNILIRIYYPKLHIIRRDSV
jgi:hypothetical protein